jgi:hypothetical protein
LVTVPSESLAVAVIVIVGFQAKTVPSAGEVMATVGSALLGAGGETVILDATLVVTPPWLSVARAVSE